MASAPGSHHSFNKHNRILACVLCQHRKIKCDRNSPCSNCVKANVTCTPSVPAPARKRRRPNQDLQERLARCEDLLKQYADGSIPTMEPSTPKTDSPRLHDSAEPPASQDSADESSIAESIKWKPTGTMVEKDGNVRFMDSFLWTSVFDELKAMKAIIDVEEPDEPSALGSDTNMNSENHADLLFSSETPHPTDDIQPDPVHVFRLWQLFLERVNPLLKIIHAPSMQSYIMDAASDMSKISCNYQALLFAIYNMAVISLSESECVQMFAMRRDRAIARFSLGIKNSLVRWNILKNYDMPSMQALLLYMFSLQGRYDRHAAWILSGTAIRVAQKMGYHRDGETLKLPPFETEMRRRIWWQLILQDAKHAMASGLSSSMLPQHWDTKQPLNINDADMFPGSTEPLRAREGPTEMAFCLIIYQISRFLVTPNVGYGNPSFEAAVLGHEVGNEEDRTVSAEKNIERHRVLLGGLVDRIAQTEKDFIDPAAGKIHVAALTIRPMLSSKLNEMIMPIREQPEWGTEIFGPKDSLFKVLIMNNEHNTDAYETMKNCGFLWFAKLHFQLDVFIVMTGRLLSRPLGVLADRAWRLVEKTYVYHTELHDTSQKRHLELACLTIKAWKAREEAMRRAGQNIQTPAFILQLMDLADFASGSDGRSSSTHPPGTSPQIPQQPQQMTELDQFLGGYLDVTALNWDMWGMNSGANIDDMSNLGPGGRHMPNGLSDMNMVFGDTPISTGMNSLGNMDTNGHL